MLCLGKTRLRAGWTGAAVCTTFCQRQRQNTLGPHQLEAQGTATVGGVRFSQQEQSSPLLSKETEVTFPPENQAYSAHLSHFIYPGERAVSTEGRREAHRHKAAAALLPLVSSFPSPAGRWAGAARRFSPLPNWNPIHTQPRASGRLSCGCSSPVFSCHNIDTKQNNSDGKTLPGSGRQIGKETGSSRLHYCVGQGSRQSCFQAPLLSITPADKGGMWDAGGGGCKLRSTLSLLRRVNVCIGRTSSLRLS